MKATLAKPETALSTCKINCVPLFCQPTILEQVSTKTAYPAPGVGKNIVLVDFGLKHSILREFSKRDCNVMVVPHDITAEEILHLNPDGVMLSNGPGNPEDVPHALDMIRGIQGKIPILVFVWVTSCLVWRMVPRPTR